MSEARDENDEEKNGELEHEEARELLDAWKDGELDAREASRVEAHVKSCERCKRVDELLGGGLKQAIAGAPESSTEILPGVQRRIRLRSRGRFYADATPRKMPSPWPLMIASLALLAALVVSYLLLGQVGQVGTPNVAPSTPAPSTTPSSPAP
jgi:predicted anti-sigma-YlaC factor YlaD